MEGKLGGGKARWIILGLENEWKMSGRWKRGVIVIVIEIEIEILLCHIVSNVS